ncbi:DUF4440 domain-containing protein [Rhizobium sp. YJ-22]|uniref:DUF4440 domain-containing protein n=1 Tax=Rhizobium sp. YJ-22 TaxID=3037556 RepID=UPI002412A970|nr:DUF4440 domain-containing protein [Rhizobium sp. YJ-22]MDG3575540.1 DUF4440 domain-containing protein [Rhizobium sp. YJ-22]
MADSLFETARREIVELHDFFVRWFVDDGRPAPDFARFETAMAADMTMIPPSGAVLDRAAVVHHVRAARGAVDKDFRIEIEDVRAHLEDERGILVSYVEAQWRNGQQTRRRSSVLLTRNDAAPLGLEWRYLHETWLQAPNNSAD